MSTAPLLSYGIDHKSKWAILNGLRRCAGVSLFLPLILIWIKWAAASYLKTMQAGGMTHASPVYQQYAAAIDLLVNSYAIGGFAIIDLMIFAMTLAVFGVVISARVRQSNEHRILADRNNLRAILLSGVAVIVAVQSLRTPWHANAALTPAARNAAMPYSPR